MSSSISEKRFAGLKEAFPDAPVIVDSNVGEPVYYQEGTEGKILIPPDQPAPIFGKSTRFPTRMWGLLVALVVVILLVVLGLAIAITVIVTSATKQASGMVNAIGEQMNVRRVGAPTQGPRRVGMPTQARSREGMWAGSRPAANRGSISFPQREQMRTAVRKAMGKEGLTAGIPRRDPNMRRRIPNNRSRLTDRAVERKLSRAMVGL